MSFKWRLLFFIIGVAGIVVMFIELPTSDIVWSDLFDTNTIFLCLGLFALWLLIYSVHTFSYKVILSEERNKIKFFSMFKICMTGFALNSVTPAGLVGGEPYRIMELRRFCSKEKATSSTLLFSMFYIVGHIIAWMLSILIYLILGCPGEAYVTVLLCTAGVFGLAGLFVFFASKKKGFVYPFIKFLTRLPLIKKWAVKTLETKAEHYKAIDNNMIEFRKHNGFFTVLALQVLSRLLEAVEYMIMFSYLGAHINFFEAILVFGTSSLIANLVFLIPMQAGTREAGLFIALSFLKHIPNNVGPLVCIIYRLRDFLCVFVGIAILLISKKSQKEKRTLLASAVGEQAPPIHEEESADG